MAGRKGVVHMMEHAAPSWEGVRRTNHGRSFDRRDVWVGLKPTARFTNELCLPAPIRKTAKEGEGKTVLSEWRSVLRSCLTGPTLLEISGIRCQPFRRSSASLIGLQSKSW